MKLKSLNISRVGYGEKAGTLAGGIEFTGQFGDVKLTLSDEQVADILSICASAIVSAATVTSNLLIEEVLEVKQIGPIEVVAESGDF
jgi:hypothetical protein